MLPSENGGLRNIYCDLLGRVGFRARQLMDLPPPGYRFLGRARWPDRVADAAIRVDSLWRVRHALNRFLPTNLLVSYGPMRLKKPPPGVDLTYSDSPLIFRREPWVVGVEVVTQFSGYSLCHLQRYRGIVERALESPYCRAIVCWSEAARRSVLERLNPGERLAQKLHAVYPAGLPKDFVKPPVGNGAPVRLLLVSSLVTPGGFELKGGREALEAFRALRQRYPHLELIVRCDLDEKTAEQYRGLPRLRLVREPVPRRALEEFYEQADIFWYPAHSLSSVVVLEAMSYGLPVVTTDYYDNAEFIEDGRTGMVVPHLRHVPPWDTSPEEVRAALPVPEPSFIDALVRKTAALIENPELRRRLGQAAREEVERGKFSLEHKNRQLKAIFDGAIDTR